MLFIPRQTTPIALSHQVPVTKVATIEPAVKTVASVVKAPQSEPPAPVPVTPAVAPAPDPAPVTPTTHDELMAAAGIDPADYGAVDYIISHESGWDPDATEPTTGAHGLPQALPYSKTGCGWDDAVCQLEWANTYAIARYGGWWQAQAYWSVNRNW